MDINIKVWPIELCGPNWRNQSLYIMQALSARNLDDRQHLQKKMEGELERGLSKKQEKMLQLKVINT